MNGASVDNDSEPKKVMLLKFFLLFLIVVGVGLTISIVFLKNRPSTDSSTIDALDYKEIALGGEASIEELIEYIKQVDYEIAETSSPESKSAMYSNRAGTLSNYLNFPGYDFKEQVLNDAKKAEESYPTAYTAIVLSWYEQEYGDESMAQYYQQLAEERGLDMEVFGRG